MSMRGMLLGEAERMRRGFWRIAFAIMCILPLSACGVREEEIPMGRYADREVKLPGEGYEYMHPCPDGSYWLFGNDLDLTHVAADGTVSRESWGWENNANIHVKFSYGVSDGGAVIFGYTPMFYSDEEYEAYAAEGDNRYLYYYVSGEGDRHPLELHGTDYRKATNLETFAFAPDERIYAASDSCVYRIDAESGETESLFATAAQVREFVFVGSTMLAVDGEKAYLYDMAEEKLLEENGRICYAGRLFQKEHPDVLVRYETGMDGDNAVSREDALKNLNTRILAGDVPDVIILDDMDMEQYADKGVLRELDGLLAPYMEEDVLYRNIVEGMRMTEKSGIYGVPLTVELPLYLGEKKYVEDMQGLEGIVAGAELARVEHPEGPLIDTPYQENLFDLLIPLCLPAWTKADGGPDTESLEEFFRNAARLWELDSEGMSEEERRKWQQDLTYEGSDVTNLMFGQYDDIYNFGETWIALGYLKNAWYGVTNLHTRLDNYRNDYSYYKKLEDEVVCGRMTGQAGNIYRARTIVGLCEQAKEPELGETFLELLLSDTMMQKWWLEGNFDGGVPIRKDSLASILDINNHAFAEIRGWTAKDISTVYKEYFWPTEEERQWLFRAMEESDRCYRTGTLLEETVRDVGVRVLDGELTPEEGAGEVERKMAIAMEE